MNNRKSVTVEYDDKGNGKRIVIFNHGKTRIYKYNNENINLLFQVVSKLEWECDRSVWSELYFYYVGWLYIPHEHKYFPVYAHDGFYNLISLWKENKPCKNLLLNYCNIPAEIPSPLKNARKFCLIPW